MPRAPYVGKSNQPHGNRQWDIFFSPIQNAHMMIPPWKSSCMPLLMAYRSSLWQKTVGNYALSFYMEGIKLLIPFPSPPKKGSLTATEVPVLFLGPSAVHPATAVSYQRQQPPVSLERSILYTLTIQAISIIIPAPLNFAYRPLSARAAAWDE